jgi:hypothetical protein
MTTSATQGNIGERTLFGFLNVNLIVIINSVMVVHTGGMIAARRQIHRFTNWLHGFAYGRESKERRWQPRLLRSPH